MSHYDAQETYLEDREIYLKKKRSGGALMVPGFLLMVGAGGLGYVYGSGGSIGFLVGGIIVELMGDIMFIGGISMIAKGNRGLRALDAKTAKRQTGVGAAARTCSLGFMTGSSPGLSARFSF
jgi:hypothetical protein